ncbi:MAG: asparagine synthetase B, partial [Candidatus Cloacimonetes bacterium]|nr:asparagine synthetase B [Candidatus Cloacimonadota bacterium]
MCGIVTVYNKGTNEVKKEVLEGMTQVINHRGPDDTGYYYHKNVGMGFKRLSIIDLSTGMQPMSNEDGKLWLVFNGEIYNYLDLREILIAKGHKFHTNTDCEVVLHLYEEHGVDSVTRLRGMFAFTTHDQVKNE